MTDYKFNGILFGFLLTILSNDGWGITNNPDNYGNLLRKALKEDGDEAKQKLANLLNLDVNIINKAMEDIKENVDISQIN